MRGWAWAWGGLGIGARDLEEVSGTPATGVSCDATHLSASVLAARLPVRSTCFPPHHLIARALTHAHGHRLNTWLRAPPLVVRTQVNETERVAVITKAAGIRVWLEEKIEAQKAQEQHLAPAFTRASVQAKLKTLQDRLRRLSRRKPLPPPPPPSADKEKATDAGSDATDDAKAEGTAEEAAAAAEQEEAAADAADAEDAARAAEEAEGSEEGEEGSSGSEDSDAAAEESEDDTASEDASVEDDESEL